MARDKKMYKDNDDKNAQKCGFKSANDRDASRKVIKKWVCEMYPQYKTILMREKSSGKGVGVIASVLFDKAVTGTNLKGPLGWRTRVEQIKEWIKQNIESFIKQQVTFVEETENKKKRKQAGESSDLETPRKKKKTGQEEGMNLDDNQGYGEIGSASKERNQVSGNNNAIPEIPFFTTINDSTIPAIPFFTILPNPHMLQFRGLSLPSTLPLPIYGVPQKPQELFHDPIIGRKQESTIAIGVTNSNALLSRTDELLSAALAHPVIASPMDIDNAIPNRNPIYAAKQAHVEESNYLRPESGENHFMCVEDSSVFFSKKDEVSKSTKPGNDRFNSKEDNLKGSTQGSYWEEGVFDGGKWVSQMDMFPALIFAKDESSKPQDEVNKPSEPGNDRFNFKGNNLKGGAQAPLHFEDGFFENDQWVWRSDSDLFPELICGQDKPSKPQKDSNTKWQDRFAGSGSKDLGNWLT